MKTLNNNIQITDAFPCGSAGANRAAWSWLTVRELLIWGRASGNMSDWEYIAVELADRLTRAQYALAGIDTP